MSIGREAPVVSKPFIEWSVARRPGWRRSGATRCAAEEVAIRGDGSANRSNLDQTVSGHVDDLRHGDGVTGSGDDVAAGDELSAIGRFVEVGPRKPGFVLRAEVHPKVNTDLATPGHRVAFDPLDARCLVQNRAVTTPATFGPPTRADVERKFVELLAGRSTRDEVDRWAARWVAADDSNVDDDVVWWGLMQLFGIDMRHGPGEPYLHDTEQISEWLDEFRRHSADEG